MSPNNSGFSQSDGFPRLSDRIYYALDLALSQGDLAIAELLLTALEQAMTRSAGGGEFIERRAYPPEFIEAFERLEKLKAKVAKK